MSEAVKAFIAEGNTCLKAGDRDGAALAWCRALDLDPHLASAHNNLGAVSLMAGQPWLALPCFLTSTRLRPDQAGFWIGLVRTLVELGETARGAACLDQACRRLPDDASLKAAAAQYPADDAIRARFDGMADRSGQTAAADQLASLAASAAGGDPAQALETGRALVWVLPERPGLWVTLSRLAMACGHWQQAEFNARRAIALAPDETDGWHALATVLSEAETRRDDVERVLLRALDLCGPRLRLADAYCNHCLAHGRPDKARALLERLPDARIGEAAHWHLLEARVLDASGDGEAAADIFRSALAQGAPPAPLLIAAAIYHERDLDPEAWLSLYAGAVQLGADLDQADLHHAHARALLRSGEIEQADQAIKAALAGGLADEARRGARFTAGRIADQLGRHDEAWRHFEVGNRLLETGWEIAGPCDHTRPLARLESLSRRLDAEIASGVRAAVTPQEAPRIEAGHDLAFLIGFPRSGTTLLDSVLRSHSAIQVVEECPVLIEALRAVVPGMAGDETEFSEDWLDGVDAADVGELRAAYRRRLAHHAGTLEPGVSVVDKLPLNLNWVAVIHRIFPAAGFILARRHPLDVAVSNFAQDFAPNNAMMVMTRLERIAALHQGSFDLWDRFVDWRRPRWADVVYERLIDDPETAIAPVMAMLGRDWESQQARFFETARARRRISTPSAHQVTRPLYTGSRARWRHYAEFLDVPACAPLRERAQVWEFATETDGTLD